jgi:hypothetical protein
MSRTADAWWQVASHLHDTGGLQAASLETYEALNGARPDPTRPAVQRRGRETWFRPALLRLRTCSRVGWCRVEASSSSWREFRRLGMLQRPGECRIAGPAEVATLALRVYRRLAAPRPVLSVRVELRGQVAWARELAGLDIDGLRVASLDSHPGVASPYARQLGSAGVVRRLGLKSVTAAEVSDVGLDARRDTLEGLEIVRLDRWTPSLLEQLSRMRGLRELTLRGTLLALDEQDSPRFWRAVSLPGLRELRVEDDSLAADLELHDVGAALKRLSNLVALSLAGQCLRGCDMPVLLDALPHMPRLCQLDLRRNEGLWGDCPTGMFRPYSNLVVTM